MLVFKTYYQEKNQKKYEINKKLLSDSKFLFFMTIILFILNLTISLVTFLICCDLKFLS